MNVSQQLSAEPGSDKSNLSNCKSFLQQAAILSNKAGHQLELLFLDITFGYIWVCVFIIPAGLASGVETFRFSLSLVFGALALFCWVRKQSQIKVGLSLIGVILSVSIFVGFGRDSILDAFRVMRLFSVFFFLVVVLSASRPALPFFVRYSRFIFIATGVLLFSQLAFFRFEGPILVFRIPMSGQTTLYNLDPNYSGFFILLFLIAAYLFKQRFWLLLSVLASCFIASRNLLVGIGTFGLLIAWRALTPRRFILSHRSLATSSALALKFLVLVFISLILSIAISEIYPTFRQTLKETETYQNVHDFTARRLQHRFFNFLDNSNEQRFARNRTFFREITENPRSFLFGLKNYPSEGGMTVHHTLFDIAGRYGVPSALLFIFLVAFCLWWFPVPDIAIVPLGTLVIFGLFIAGVYDGKTWLFIFLASLLSPKNYTCKASQN